MNNTGASFLFERQLGPRPKPFNTRKESMSKPNAYRLGETTWVYEYSTGDTRHFSCDGTFVSEWLLKEMGAVPIDSKQIEKLDEFDSNTNRQLTEKINEIIDYLQKG